MINCIALDDEPMALEVIKSFCNDIPDIELTHTFTQASLAAKHLRKFPVDLIFLDIQMPDVNGIDFYKSLKQETMVIFTTAFSEYAVEGFNVSAIDYLLKPISFERFQEACSKAIDYSNYLKSGSKETQQHLYVRAEYALFRIPFSEILFLETMDDYIKIYRQNDKPVLTLMSLSRILEKLPENDFIRVHRSYAVSIKKINSVKGKRIKLDKSTIPIGSTYHNHFFQVFNSSKS